jgi:hypothetical protein
MTAYNNQLLQHSPSNYNRKSTNIWTILQFKIKLSRINIGTWILSAFLLPFYFLKVSTCHLKHEFLVNNILKLSSYLTLLFHLEDQLINAVREIMSVYSENHMKQIHSVSNMRADNMLKQVVHIVTTAF